MVKREPRAAFGGAPPEPPRAPIFDGAEGMCEYFAIISGTRNNRGAINANDSQVPRLLLEAEPDLVRPEALEPLEGLIGRLDERQINAPNLLNGAELTVVERREPIADFNTRGR